MKLILITLALLATSSFAADKADLPTEYERDVTKWMALNPPTGKSSRELHDSLDRRPVMYARWTVTRENGAVAAILVGSSWEERAKLERPKFPMAVRFGDGDSRFGEPSSLQKVRDGWLASYDGGEFGTAVWWYSSDGKVRYLVPGQWWVNQFITHGDRIFAVEGLAHGSSRGSLVEFKISDGKWAASTFVKLPDCGRAAVVLADGRFCVVTDESMAIVSLDGKVDILLSKGRWDHFQPGSIVADAKSEHVYIGMDHFVARYNLRTNDHTFQYLIPTRKWLNPIPDRAPVPVPDLPDPFPGQ